ncbi:MAG: PEP-CTERM sorting domain-containing protein [Candidatus Schekmanbacteria bacterium]|nr:MAG: PEP-CTERM sorting domain-containing protein [Candidatus Schekmanbacteria bacterium]
MKKFLVISLVSMFAVVFALVNPAGAAIDLAPVAEGSAGTEFHQTFYYTSSGSSFSTTSSQPFVSSITGSPNHIIHTSVSSYVNSGPFIRAARYITSFSTSTGYSSTYVSIQRVLKGIVEFDISSLSSLSGPFTAQLRLDFHKLNISSNIPVTVSLYDMTEATEDGTISTFAKGAKIADILNVTPYGNPPSGFYYFDVTSELVADLANIGSNTYSGFIIDYDVPDPSFPMDHFYDALGEVDFQNYDGGGSEGPLLTINTAPIPEPTSLILLGSGLIGVYFIRRKLK